MSKLIFCYGAMNSGKSMQLLTWKYNYEEAGFKVFLYKPAMDTRGSFKDSENKGVISSRVGLEAKCTLVYEDETFYKYLDEINDPKTIIMVDEAQFLTQKQVKELYEISLKYTTKEQNSAMKEQLSDMQKKVDKIYEVIINERTQNDFN